MGRKKKGAPARERLLQAALGLFAERGPKASVDEIAQRAHVAKGTVYYHFKGKRKLLQRALEMELDRLTVPATTDPERRLRGTLEGLVQWVISRPERLQALLLAGQPGSGLGVSASRQLWERLIRLLRETLLVTQAAKLVEHSWPAELLAVALFGALIHILDHLQREGRPLDPQRLSAALLKLFLRRP